MNYSLIVVVLVSLVGIFYSTNFRIAQNSLFLAQHQGWLAAIRYYFRNQ